jgi:hypothetical protein
MGIAARFRQDPAKYLLTTVIVSLPLAFCCFGWWFVRYGPKIGGDCVDMAPARVFKSVFGYLPPPGIAQLSAAGQMSLGGAEIYLRFRATDHVIHDLTSGGKRSVKPKERIQSTPMPQVMQWRERVRWSEVSRIPDPECYTLLPHAPAANPDITLVVDRCHHLVYVYSYAS